MSRSGVGSFSVHPYDQEHWLFLLSLSLLLPSGWNEDMVQMRRTSWTVAGAAGWRETGCLGELTELSFLKTLDHPLTFSVLGEK